MASDGRRKEASATSAPAKEACPARRARDDARRIGRLTRCAVLVTASLASAACGDAVHLLGTLPVDTSHRAPCADGSTLLGAASGHDACVASDHANAGTGGAPGRADSGAAAEANASTDGGPSSDATACTERRSVGIRRGLNLFLLVDDSLSVVLQPLWDRLTAAISRFVDDPANTGVGVGITYYGLSCTPNDYSTPKVPIGTLPSVAATIKSSYPLPINGKAITPAMEGAAAYVRAVKAGEPDRDTVLVLITDGILDPVCLSSEASAVEQARLALQGSPPVQTYVIGLGAGPTLTDPINVGSMASLDAIAAAGETGVAARVEVNSSADVQLDGALASVARVAEPCQYRAAGALITDGAAAEWQTAVGDPIVRWRHVASAAACAGGAGVFTSDTTGYLELCPASCDAVRANPSGTLWVVDGC